MKHYSFLILLSLYLLSCTSDIIMEDNSQEVTENCLKQSENLRTTELTCSDAQKIASIFQHRTQSRAVKNVIKDINTITDNQSNPLMYIINYENNGGYVIVSATKKYYPILAYSDTGTFQDSDSEMKLCL
ncbi:Spi family protease inhibitor [Phocaeicola sp.]|uniref:Spi family protease inhibitor n=1 Tax=Phocaeicola sp. TaxID=2773926 RepID=UPI0023BC5E84|nr:Spi family protease inhibitor [Phocaeicola sp.]MDE5677484.1 Spi family protease inhibitor [Phocaeicola sp.]